MQLQDHYVCWMNLGKALLLKVSVCPPKSKGTYKCFVLLMVALHTCFQMELACLAEQ